MESRPNPYIGVNYLPRNSDTVSTPPAYWLQRLYDFDSDLVVFPSIQVPYAYVLARHARRTGGMNGQDPQLQTHASQDTRFCIERRLLPVSLIYRTSSASWSIDNIINDLRSRDTWAVGGAEKYVDLADASDAAVEKKQKDTIRDDMWNRSGDAWRSYQARTGQRTKTHYGHRSKATQTA